MRILDWLTAAAFSVSLLGVQGPLVAQETENSSAASPGAVGAAEAPLADKLSAPAELAFQDTPLSELPNWLRVHHGVQAILDVKTLEEVGVERDSPVTLKLRGVSLRSALRHLLRQQDLTWRVDGELLIVTTPEEAEQHERAVVYPVLDLVQGEGEGNDETGFDYDTLLDLIINMPAPDSWDFSGPVPLTPSAGMLIIPQTDEVHEKIAALFDALRRAKRLAASEEAAESRGPIIAESPSNARIRKELAKPTQLEFAVTPLDKAIEQVSRTHEIPVILDAKALEDAGVPLDSPVSLAAKGMPLGQTLQCLVAQHDLVTAVRQEALVITTPEEAEQSCVGVRVYPIGDVLAESTEEEATTNPETLISAIYMGVGREVWGSAGGPGQISYFPPSKALVVAQLDEVHDQLAEVLEDYRREQSKLHSASHAKQPADDDLSVRAYGLLAQPAGSEITTDEVARLLKEFVAPQTWGSDPEVQMRAVGGRLVIRQRYSVHKQIDKFLVELGVAYPYRLSKRMGGVGMLGGMGGMGMGGVQGAPAVSPPTTAPKPPATGEPAR